MAAIVTEALEMSMFFAFTQGYNWKERQVGLRATKNKKKKKKIKAGKKIKVSKMSKKANMNS